MKKELARVFTDKKLIFTIFIMPGLLLFSIYSLMGVALSKVTEPEEHYEIYQIGLPENLKQTVKVVLESDEKTTVSFVDTTVGKIDELKEEIQDKNVILLVHFDPDNEKLAYYFSQSDIQSTMLFQTVSSIISASASKTVIEGIEVDILVEPIDEDTITFNIMAMMLPMLIITFLFQGALAVGPESIAGDKERGTIATLLATPTKRSEIALGKIFSLSILAVLSSLSSFIAIMTSLPTLMQSEGAQLNYSFGTYMYILVVLIMSVVLIISIISIISAFAKNVKEATSLSAPVMLLAMGTGIFMMFDSAVTNNLFVYFIPIFNTSLLLKNAFSGVTNLSYLLVAGISNLVITGLLVLALTRMFNSENRMFSKS